MTIHNGCGTIYAQSTVNTCTTLISGKNIPMPFKQAAITKHKPVVQTTTSSFHGSPYKKQNQQPLRMTAHKPKRHSARSLIRQARPTHSHDVQKCSQQAEFCYVFTASVVHRARLAPLLSDSSDSGTKAAAPSPLLHRKVGKERWHRCPLRGRPRPGRPPPGCSWRGCRRPASPCAAARTPAPAG